MGVASDAECVEPVREWLRKCRYDSAADRNPDSDSSGDVGRRSIAFGPTSLLDMVYEENV